jgi:hypothetical protein
MPGKSSRSFESGGIAASTTGARHAPIRARLGAAVADLLAREKPWR